MLDGTMARGVFEHKLDHLQEKLLVMGSQVGCNLAASAVALQKRDRPRSVELISGDEQINEMQVTIEQMCLGLIATQQPKARDLRLITAVMTIARELERINDYAKSVAKINLQIGHEPLLPAINDICRMGENVSRMLLDGMNAFIDRNADQAYAVHTADAQIDHLYSHIQQELIASILGDNRHTNQAYKLMWASHNLERAGDRIGNICERVVFLITGEIIEFSHTESVIPTY